MYTLARSLARTPARAHADGSGPLGNAALPAGRASVRRYEAGGQLPLQGSGAVLELSVSARQAGKQSEESNERTRETETETETETERDRETERQRDRERAKPRHVQFPRYVRRDASSVTRD